MTPPKETPASLRRQAEGTTGAGISGRSVSPAPGWARKRAEAALVRFRGEYSTPAALRVQLAAEAIASRAAADAAVPTFGESRLPGAGGRPFSESPATHPVSRFAERIEVDEATGEILGGTPSLPCRSLETTQTKGEPAGLSGPHRKVANALSWNVAHLCREFGIHRVGFLTLTFADHVTDIREASRRFNSLATRVLRERYAAHIRVVERQKSGRIHYHLLVVLPDDIRTGADFDAFAKRDYRSANNHLRREWAFWRHTAPLYRFGRTELMPIRSDAAALGQYVGKYIGKHIGQREERDKGARLVSYSKAARMATSKHAEVSKYPNEWRAKVLTFARIVQGMKPHARIHGIEDVALALNDNRWAYNYRDFILGLPPADLGIPF